MHVLLQVRLDMYRKRKAYLEGILAAESAKLESQARFIVEIIEGKLVIGKPIVHVCMSSSITHYVRVHLHVHVYTGVTMYMYMYTGVTVSALMVLFL